jgi:capsular polysaccharide transport system permease protein
MTGDRHFPGPWLRVLAALMIRETCARFGRAWGGFVWALAEPIGGVLLLTFAFSFIVRTPPAGDSFALFYATGLVPFLMYNAVANGAMGAISANRGLLTYPVVTALDTILARGLLDTLTHAAIAALLFPGFILSLGLSVSFDPGALVLSLAMAAALGLGVGTLNAVLIGFHPTWRQVWSVLNRPLFLISGVLFTPDAVPDEMAAIVGWNPLSHIIADMRAAFYGPEPAVFSSPAYVFGLSLVLFVAGAFLVQRNEGHLIQSG